MSKMEKESRIILEERINNTNKEIEKLLCPFYGTGFCEEDSNLCFNQYEECDRANELIIPKLKTDFR